MLYIWRILVLKTYCNIVDQTCGEIEVQAWKDKWQAKEITNNRSSKRNNKENEDERKLIKNERKKKKDKK